MAHPAARWVFVVGIGLALGPLACSSADDSGSAAEAPASVIGKFRTNDGGALRWVEFRDSIGDALERSGAFEEGTYAFDDARAKVTFTSSAGASTTLDFAVIESKPRDPGLATSTTRVLAAGLVNPGGATLVQGPRPLIRDAETLGVDGSLFQRVAVQARCPGDIRLVFPDRASAAIGTGGQCQYYDM